MGGEFVHLPLTDEINGTVCNMKFTTNDEQAFPIICYIFKSQGAINSLLHVNDSAGLKI